MIYLDYYHLFIKDFESAGTPGAGCEVHFKLNAWTTVSGGIDGITFRNISCYHNDIHNTGWASVAITDRSNISVIGYVEALRRCESSIALIVRLHIADPMWLGMVAADRPERLGASLSFSHGCFSVVCSIFCQPPLGWTQQLTFRMRWF